MSCVRIIGNKYGDKGTYDEDTGGHGSIVIKFILNGIPFKHQFWKTPSSSRSVSVMKYDIKRKLKACGLDNPNLSVNMFTSMTKPSFLESFYLYLDS